MGAGTPNYQRLHEMGKLPKNQRSKILGLSQADEAEKELENLKVGLCDECREKLLGEKKEDSSFSMKCDVEGCTTEVKAKSEKPLKALLGSHKKKEHKPKE